MKKNTLIQLCTVLALTLFGCEKEAPVTSVEQKEIQKVVQDGHFMTLSLGLPADTKMTHDLDGTTIKPKWEVGDRIRVINGSNNNDGTWMILQDSDITNDGKSAIFTSTNTTVEANSSITIYYNSPFKGGKNMAESYDFSSQDGSYENLPEVLVARNVKIEDGAISLSPALTRFHFVFNNTTNPGMILQDGTISSITIKKVWGTAQLGTSYNSRSKAITEGDITITPATPFTVSKDDSWSIDFYVAAYIYISESTDALFCLTLNPASADGIAYEYNWYPTKTYSTAKVYKASPKFNGYKIPRGKRLTLNYNTANASPIDYYSYWRMLMYNGSETDYFSDLRCDYWNNKTDRAYMYSTNNFTNYHKIMNGGTTVMTIDNSENGYTFVQSTSSHAGETEEVYSQTYAHSASDYIRIKLLPDGSTVTMNSASLEDIPAAENAQSVTTSFTSKYEGLAGKIVLNPDLIPVTVTYGNSYSSLISKDLNQYSILPADGVIDYNNNAVIHFRGNDALTGNVPTATASSILSSAGITVLPTSGTATEQGFVAHSEYKWTVAPYSSQTIGMTLTESAATERYYCPLVDLYGADGTTSYGTGAMVNHFWNSGSPTYGLVRGDFTCVPTWSNDEEIKTALAASPKVYVTVSNNGTGEASMRWYITYEIDEKAYTRTCNYDKIPIPAGENIIFCLDTDHCKITF